MSGRESDSAYRHQPVRRLTCACSQATSPCPHSIDTQRRQPAAWPLVIRPHHPARCPNPPPTLSRAMLAFGACVLIAGFTGPLASRAVPRTGLAHVRMSDDSPSLAGKPKPSCVIDAEGTAPISKQFKEDCDSMGSMGAYMSIRSYMAEAFNAADADSDGFITKDQLGSCLAALREEANPSMIDAQFSAADTRSIGKVTYEQWCKVQPAPAPYEHAPRRYCARSRSLSA